jgi:HEAT repeat protein
MKAVRMKANSALAIGASLVLMGCQNMPNVQPGAKSILEAFRPPPPEIAARQAVNAYNSDDRFRGTQQLSSASFAGEAPYVALFAQNAKDKDAGVRAVSARALGNNGRSEHAALVAELLAKDEDPVVRIESARALQRLHDGAVVPVLLERLKPSAEEEPQVRLECASALGQYRENRVVEALIAALGDDDLAVNERARGALRTLTGQDLGTSQRAWQAWYKESENLFAGSLGYRYPVFDRGKFWYEYIPFVSQPPNEVPSIPAGLDPLQPMPAQNQPKKAEGEAGAH